MKSIQVRKLTYAALFLALAMVLPFITGQIPEIGKALSPMHIPVLLCGFLCGWPWGLAVGFIAPLLRSVIFGMPAMFPGAVALILAGLSGGSFTWALFLSGAVTSAIPGIILHIVLIPILVMALERAGLSLIEKK